LLRKGQALITKDIHVIGIDPGGTTGWCRLTVPRDSIYGNEPGQILRWEYGEEGGDEARQVQALARLARGVQSLDYQIGPALVIEAWDQDPTFKSTDPEALSPARIGGMFLYAKLRGDLGDAIVTFQGRQLAKSTLNDERLQAAGMYVKGSAHVRDATRHALTALRRARKSPELRYAMWGQD
jgi:hypothetical protein